ncbi:MAG: hypothetical protein ACYCQJ_09330 [Nitrososphaerales archaeon]
MDDPLVPASEERQVYLYLKDVKEGLFTKYDWLFLNDRIVFIKPSGIGTFVTKTAVAEYTSVLGPFVASALIKRLRDLRRKKTPSLSVQDIQNILKVNPRNSQIFYSEMSLARMQPRTLGGYTLIVFSKKSTRKATLSWTKVSFKNIRLFFRARLGSRFIER